MLSSIRQKCLRAVEVLFFGGRRGLENADEALRYLPISDLILRDKCKSTTILEVGSGVKGITPYIPHRVTGVDVVFNGPVAPNLDPICLSGDKLPFEDGSYDIVISVDMLEHVPESKRLDVITELLRVAKSTVYLAVPCGKASEEHDSALDDLYYATCGKRYPFFQEHVDLGLPTREELELLVASSAAALGLSVATRVLPNVNLKVRESFMRLWITSKNPKIYAWVSPLICMCRHFLDFGVCYRQLVVVSIVRAAEK